MCGVVDEEGVRCEGVESYGGGGQLPSAPCLPESCLVFTPRRTSMHVTVGKRPLRGVVANSVQPATIDMGTKNKPPTAPTSKVTSDQRRATKTGGVQHEAYKDRHI